MEVVENQLAGLAGAALPRFKKIVHPGEECMAVTALVKGGEERCGDRRAIGDFLYQAAGNDIAADPGEVLPMAADDRPQPEDQGLKEVLAAEGQQAAADEGGRRQGVGAGQFPKDIPDDHRTRRLWLAYLGTADGRQPFLPQALAPYLGPLKVFGEEGDNAVRAFGEQVDDHRQEQLFLLTAHRAEQDHGGIGWVQVVDRIVGGACLWRGDTVEFDIVHQPHPLATEHRGKALAVGGGDGVDRLRAIVAEKAGEMTIGAVTLLRHAAVDQQHRDVAPCGIDEKARPQFGLDDHRQPRGEAVKGGGHQRRPVEREVGDRGGNGSGGSAVECLVEAVDALLGAGGGEDGERSMREGHRRQLVEDHIDQQRLAARGRLQPHIEGALGAALQGPLRPARLKAGVTAEERKRHGPGKVVKKEKRCYQRFIQEGEGRRRPVRQRWPDPIVFAGSFQLNFPRCRRRRQPQSSRRQPLPGGTDGFCHRW